MPAAAVSSIPIRLVRLLALALNVAGSATGAVSCGTRAESTAATPQSFGPVDLSIPGRVRGTLDAHDQALQYAAAADDYVLTLEAGRPVTVVVRGGPSATRPGTNLDVVAILLREGREVARDDDSASDGQAGNSRIVFTPVETGAHVLRVTTFGPGLKQGAYAIETWAGERPQQH